jgi:23S rRNA pseudouridine2605 synthase
MASGFSGKAVCIMETKPQRLQKILAAAGLASRRKAEELIAAGVVSVNGQVITEPGSKADPRADEIRVDGKLLRGPERHVYIALYKPKGHMTTVSDPEGRPTVMDLLKDVEERVFPVGRLDYMSEGLLLLTNDGELMAQLTKAGSHVAKTYMVKVSGKPTEEQIDKLRNGIMLPPEPGLAGARGKKQPGVERRSFAVLTQPAVIQLAVDQENPWYEVTLTEGRNRQIRRMFEQIGYHIEKIKRVRYGSLTLDVEPGEFRHLTPKEVNQLRKSLETPFKPRLLKVKRKDDRPTRAPRVDAARFVKGRRGAPAQATGETPGTSAAPRREFKPREQSRPFTRPRGPEFESQPARREGGFAPKRPFVRKDDDRFSASPRERSGPPKRTGSAYARFDKPKEGAERFGEARGRRNAPPQKTGFGFARFDKPKFVKPSKHRDLGSDNTHDFNERKPVGERPFVKKPFGAQSDRRFSRGPGKPVSSSARGEDFKGGSGRDFKPRSGGPGKSFGPKREGFAPKREGFAPKREGFAAGPKRQGFGEKREGFAPRRDGFTPKREGFGSGPKREGFGSGPKRDGFAPKRPGFASGPKREGFAPKREGFGSGPKRPGFGGPSRGARPGGAPRPGRPSGLPRKRRDEE